MAYAPVSSRLVRTISFALLALAAHVVSGTASGQTYATFDAACAALPTSRFVVTTIPVSWTEGETLTIDQLNAKTGRTPGRHMTFGLTTVSFGHRTRIAVATVNDAKAGRACGTLDVEVTLSMEPVTVYLAQELDASGCARGVTFEHEMKHVAVFQQVLDETARELALGLPAAFAPGLQRGASEADLQQRLKAQINEYLAEFMRRQRATLDGRQQEVDSPAEHARVKGACP